PNYVWNRAHDFASYRHTEANAALGRNLVHPDSLAEFLLSQLGVFGPVLFGALAAIALTARRSLAERRALLLATFALPTLGMMLIVAFLSRAHPNWSAPTYVSSAILVAAWLLRSQ